MKTCFGRLKTFFSASRSAFWSSKGALSDFWRREARFWRLKARFGRLEACFRRPKARFWCRKTRFGEVTSRYVSNGEIFVSEAGSAIFGFLRRFPIEWCKSRLCTLHLVRFWAKIRFRCDSTLYVRGWLGIKSRALGIRVVNLL